MPAKLTANSYGKSDVRLTKIIRDGDRHELLEFSVDVELIGDFARSYTHGENAQVIATDSIKNTVYVLARENRFNCAEEFAILLAEHFSRTYSQVEKADVKIRQTNWARIDVNDRPHDHAFICGGADLSTARATASRDAATVVIGGVADLLILKTTRSAFKGFVTDKFRTLRDADDRIFATKLSADWIFASSNADFVSARKRILSSMLNIFATQMSHAVQETMYQMGDAALAAAAEIKNISLAMPNKHRIPVNLQAFNLDNPNEIFVWTDEPFGNITAVVEREK
jgi:urate oxidase